MVAELWCTWYELHMASGTLLWQACDLAVPCMQVHYDLWPNNSPMGQRYSWLAITSGAAGQAAAEPLLGPPGTRCIIFIIHTHL